MVLAGPGAPFARRCCRYRRYRRCRSRPPPRRRGVQAAGDGALRVSAAGEHLHQHAVVEGIGDIDVAARVHRHAIWDVQAAGDGALRVSAPGERLLQHAVVAAVGDIDVAARVHRHADGEVQAAGDGALRVSAAGERLHQHAVVACIGDIDVAARVHRHAIWDVQAAGDGALRAAEVRRLGACACGNQQARRCDRRPRPKRAAQVDQSQRGAGDRSDLRDDGLESVAETPGKTLCKLARRSAHVGEEHGSHPQWAC